MKHGGTNSSGMSSRRHSSLRATTHRNALRVQAVAGLGDPNAQREVITARTNTNRGGGGAPRFLNGEEKAQRVRQILAKHKKEVRNGLTEQDIREILEQDEEAEGLLQSINPELVGREEQQIAKRLEKYAMPSLGDLPTEKPMGFRRFMMTQLNGMATPAIRASKVARSVALINKYEVDIQSYVEHGLNMARLKPSETFASFFEAEVELRSVTGHNKNENPESTHQQGGTGLLANNEICQYMLGSGTDHRNLGRWSWMTLGSPKHRTRVLSIYCVGKGVTKGLGRVCQQHLRHIQTHSLNTSPYQLFKQDLRLQLTEWVNQGDRLIIMMDANEHVLNGELGKMLRSPEVGLDLEEISHKAWGGREINTYIDGSRPIDGVWASRSLEIGGFKILSYLEGVGDHRTMLFDVESRSLLGIDEHRVVRGACRRLNTKTSSLRSYTRILNRLMTVHKMEERLDALIMEIENNRPTPAQRQKMDTLDRQMVELQICAEKKCRKIIKPDLEFSPQVQLWHERMQAYKMLIRWKRVNPQAATSYVLPCVRGFQIHER